MCGYFIVPMAIAPGRGVSVRLCEIRLVDRIVKGSDGYLYVFMEASEKAVIQALNDAQSGQRICSVKLLDSSFQLSGIHRTK